MDNSFKCFSHTPRGLTQQSATRTVQLLTHSFSPAVGWGEEWTKRKTRGLRQRQFNRTKKQGIIITIKNTQNKLYTIFSHCSMTDCAASPQAANTELTDFARLADFAELMEKDRTHGKRANSQKSKSSNSRKSKSSNSQKKSSLPHSQCPFIYRA